MIIPVLLIIFITWQDYDGIKNIIKLQLFYKNSQINHFIFIVKFKTTQQKYN